MGALTQSTVLRFLLVITIAAGAVRCKKAAEKPDWAKKDLNLMSDADLERLLEQWDEDEETPEDELPEHKRPPPRLDPTKFDPSNPEAMLRMSKKGSYSVAGSGVWSTDSISKTISTVLDRSDPHVVLHGYVTDDEGTHGGAVVALADITSQQSYSSGAIPDLR